MLEFNYDFPCKQEIQTKRYKCYCNGNIIFRIYHDNSCKDAEDSHDFLYDFFFHFLKYSFSFYSAFGYRDCDRLPVRITTGKIPRVTLRKCLDVVQFFLQFCDFFFKFFCIVFVVFFPDFCFLFIRQIFIVAIVFVVFHEFFQFFLCFFQFFTDL